MSTFLPHDRHVWKPATRAARSPSHRRNTTRGDWRSHIVRFRSPWLSDRLSGTSFPHRMALCNDVGAALACDFYWSSSRSKCGKLRYRRFPAAQSKRLPRLGPWDTWEPGEFIHDSASGLFKWSPCEWESKFATTRSVHGRWWQVARWSRYGEKWIEDWRGKYERYLTEMPGERIDARGRHWLPLIWAD